MEEAGANALEVEIAPTPDAKLDEMTRTKRVKLPKPIVSQTSTGITSTHIVQMSLLDQMDIPRLKLDPENKADCCTHACNHCTTLLTISWK